MKVLFFASSALGSKNDYIGGDPSQAIGIISGFTKLSHEVIYASINPDKYLNGEKCILEHIPHYNFPVPNIRGIFNQWIAIRTVENLIHKHNPSLIISFWRPGNLFISRLKRFKIPVIMVCNGPRSKGNKSMMNVYFDRQNLHTATLVSAVSEDITEFFKNKYSPELGQKVITNPNGVDTERFVDQPNGIRETYGIDKSIPVIGFAGYFAPWHRVDILIEAFQRIEGNARLLLIGNGPEKLENDLRRRAAKKHNDRIIFTGPVPFNEIPQYYSACDILVVPQEKTRPLGSSMKLYEYLSMGKAVAAANVGQLSRVIKDGLNGKLFEPEVESLTKTLDLLIADRDLRQRLGAQARKDAVEKYTWVSNVTRILNRLN